MHLRLLKAISNNVSFTIMISVVVEFWELTRICFDLKGIHLYTVD